MHIQNDLFDVEADLCLAEKGPSGARLTVTDAQVDWLEREIDRLNDNLAPLRSFILPGGSRAAALARMNRSGNSSASQGCACSSAVFTQMT